MRLFLQWLCIAMPFFVRAQPGFNIAYDLGYARNQLRKIIVVEDTVVACGIARNDSLPNLQCLLFARFDSNGVAIDNRLICDSLQDALSVAVNWTDLIRTNDGGYAFTAGCVFRNNGMLVKLRSDLSVEFIQEFIDSVNLVEFYNTVIELPDGYLLGGYVQRPNYLQDAFLRRVDHLGNTIWLSYYGDYNLVDIFPYCYLLSDSTVLCVGGYITNDNVMPGRGPWIAIIDIQEGEVLNEWRPVNFQPWFLHYIYPLPDNQWIVYGKKALQTTPYPLSQGFSAVIDTNFQVDGVRMLGPTPTSFFWDVKPTPDGQFIAAGQINAENPNIGPDVFGWLFKFSPAPDSLWSLTLTAPIPNPDISGNFLGGVGLLSSGNMIAGGYALAGNEVWPWLVKITPDGCVDSLWCVSPPVSAPEAARLPGGRVYPNPAREYFWLDWPGDFPAGAIRLTLTTPDGRLAAQQWLGPGEPVWVAALPAGLYYWQADTGRGQYWRGKVVVQR